MHWREKQHREICGWSAPAVAWLIENGMLVEYPFEITRFGRKWFKRRHNGLHAGRVDRDAC
jgi:hypothetical protein